MASLNSKQNECVYCGRVFANLTKDHIPPKLLFAKPRPSNLITVPSCQECNSAFQKDDEYFQVIAHTRWDTGSHPELSNKDRLISSLNRRERTKFKKSIVGDMFMANLFTPSGLYVGTKPAMNIDPVRLNRVASRVIQGLFYRLKGFRLADGYEATASVDPAADNTDPLLIERMTLHMLSLSPTVIGQDVFSYRYEFHEEDENISAWVLVFYEKMLFLGSTLPIAN